MEILFVFLTSMGLAAIIFLGSFKREKFAIYAHRKAVTYIKYALFTFIYTIITILLINKIGFGLLGLLYSAMLAVLFAISVFDLRDRKISKKAFLLFMLGGLGSIVLNKDIGVINGFMSMLSVFATLWIIYRFSKESIGMGDVKLCAAAALYLGMEKAFSMLMLATVMCGAAALMLLLLDRSYRNESIPFAPFIAAGTAAVLVL